MLTQSNEDRITVGFLAYRHGMEVRIGDLFSDSGLTYAQLVYMKIIDEAGGPITMCSISKKLGVTRARVTTVLKSIRGHGYLIETPINGRAIALSLNDDGKALVARFNKVAHEELGSLLSGFSDADVSVICRFLLKMSERL